MQLSSIFSHLQPAMASPQRQFTIPPGQVLKDLARVHYLLSHDTQNPPDTCGPKQAAVATFCSLLWGKEQWQVVLNAAAEERIPTVDQQQIEYIEKKGYRTQSEKCGYYAVMMLEFAVLRLKRTDADLAALLEWCCFEGARRTRGEASFSGRVNRDA